MALNWQGLGFLFTAKDLASAVIGRIERSLGTLGPAAARAGKGMAAAFVAAGAFGAGMAGLKGAFDLAEDAARFEQKLGALKATAGAGAEDLARFKNAAMQAGLTSLYSPTEAVEGMTALAKAGLKTNDVIGMVNQALKLAGASMGKLTVEQSADFLAQTRAAFTENTPDANTIINVAAKLANESLADFNEIPGMISRITRGTKPMNQGFTDTAAILSLVRNVITSSETAATSLSMVMQALSTGGGMQKFLKTTGVNVLDAQGQFRPLLRILAEMAESPIWQKLDVGAQNDFLKKLFGSRQIGSVHAALDQLRKGVQGLNGEMVYGTKAADYLLASYAAAAGKTDIIDKYEIENMKSGGGLLDFLAKKVATLRLEIGDAFLPTLKVLASGLNTVLRTVGQVLLAIPEWVKAAAGKFVLFTLAAFTAASAVAVLVAGIVILKAVFAVVGGVLLALFLKPLLIAAAVMGVLTLIGAAFYVAWKNNIGGVATALGGFFDKIRLGVDAIVQLFSTGGTWGAVDEALQRPENSGLQNFLMTVWMWIGRVHNFFKGMWEGFQAGLVRLDGPMKVLLAAFDTFLSLLGFNKTSVEENASTFDRWGRVGESVGEVLSVLANIVVTGLAAAMWALNTAIAAVRIGWEILGPVVMSVLSMIMNVLDIFIGVFTGNWEKAGQAIMNVFYDVFDFVIAMVGGVLKVFAGGIDALGAVFGKNWGVFGQIDKALDDASFQQITRNQSVRGTGDWASVSPARAALQTQVDAAPMASMMPAPVVNVTAMTPPVILDGQVISTAVAKRERSSNIRSMIPQPAVVGER